MATCPQGLRRTKFLATAKQMTKDLLHNSRQWLLGFYPTWDIADIYDNISGGRLKQVKNLWMDMTTEKSKLVKNSDEIAKRLVDIKSQETKNRLGRLFLEGTFFKLFPHQKEFNDIKGNSVQEEARRKLIHQELHAIYTNLPADIRKLYHDVLNDLMGYWKLARKETFARIDRLLVSEKQKKIAKKRINDIFQNAWVQGIYFPLSRFGDWVGVAVQHDKDGNEIARTVSAFESEGALRRQMIDPLHGKNGWTVEPTFKSDYDRKKQGPSSDQVRQIYQLMDELGLGEQEDLKDMINQMFFNGLPDMSYTKKFMHRKYVEGFSQDFTRAYSFTSFHAAHHIGNLKYTDQIRRTIADVNSYARNDVKNNDHKFILNQVAGEFNKRLEWTETKNISPVVHMLGAFGFAFNLGGSVGSAIVNSTQPVFFTLPYLASHFGLSDSFNTMSKFYKNRSLHVLEGKKINVDISEASWLTPDQQELMKVLREQEVIDVTPSRDLAGLSALDFADRYKTPLHINFYKVQRGLSFFFHFAEVNNRQMTALAAYELATQKGIMRNGKRVTLTFDEAVPWVRDVVLGTQLDYSPENRARFFRGNIARLIGMFKTYALGVSFIYGKTLHQIYRGESAEVKAQAMKYLAGLFAVQFAVGGAIGLPIYSGLSFAIDGMINGLKDDEDDDPFKFDIWFRNALAENFTLKGGEVIAHGLSRLTPWDISSRVSQDLPDLWFRPPKEYLTGKKKFDAWATQLMGPIYNNFAQMYDGMESISRGDTIRGFEKIMPKFVRDVVKAARFTKEGGIHNYLGDPVLGELSLLETTGQLLGVAPARQAEVYEGRNFVYEMEATLNDRRRWLINQMVKARREKDPEMIFINGELIRGFNKAQPDFKITSKVLDDAFHRRLKIAAGVDKGIFSEGKKPSLLENIAFIPTSQKEK